MRADAYINIQGDEPLMNPRNIELLASELRRNRAADVVTLKVRVGGKAGLADPNCVKVAAGPDGRALYFSRSVIPFDRDAGGGVPYFKHLGLYGYRRSVLLKIVGLPVSPLEKSEKLEQLRFLENGFSVYAPTTKFDSIGVDTREDYLRVKRIVGSREPTGTRRGR
jgi:3-deoxy-manno-octulosonate cytidylyltransferase (CMP-KDO synthetase)